MIRLATVFSGIGSIEQTLKRLNVDHSIVFACDNGDVDLSLFDNKTEKEYRDLKKEVSKRTITEAQLTRLIQLEQDEARLVDEIRSKIFSLSSVNEKKKFVDELYAKNSRKRNYVRDSYFANYDISDDRFFQDIRFLDGTDFGQQVDLFVGGSPCQSFSSVGAKRGLDDVRGTLFYEFARLVRDIRPKVFIYENVRGLTTHDNGKTWLTMRNILENELGYHITEPKVLNAADYGIPQTRRRLFVVGFRDSEFAGLFRYPQPIELKYTAQDFLESNCASGHFSCSDDGSLIVRKIHGDYDPRFILTPKVRDYVLKSGTKSFATSTCTDLPIARTILKTMTQHHRAGVDNYYTVSGEGDNRVLRSLTDREALRLMGYPDSFRMVVSSPQIFRQAGNSIVVDVMMAVVKSILQTKIFD